MTLVMPWACRGGRRLVHSRASALCGPARVMVHAAAPRAGRRRGMRTTSTVEAMASVARQKARARGWAVARRVLAAVVLTVVVLAGLAGGDAALYVQRAQAETTGTLRVAGLQRPVSVLRDRWGVPHITANTLHDVAFAQGYVTAQDRLFQMVMNRRIAQGRLAGLS